MGTGLGPEGSDSSCVAREWMVEGAIVGKMLVSGPVAEKVAV